jgi:hypothetical protein
MIYEDLVKQIVGELLGEEAAKEKPTEPTPSEDKELPKPNDSEVPLAPKNNGAVTLPNGRIAFG